MAKKHDIIDHDERQDDMESFVEELIGGTEQEKWEETARRFRRMGYE